MKKTQTTRIKEKKDQERPKEGWEDCRREGADKKINNCGRNQSTGLR